jgi:hypothetical protein
MATRKNKTSKRYCGGYTNNKTRHSHTLSKYLKKRISKTQYNNYKKHFSKNNRSSRRKTQGFRDNTVV